MQGLTYDSNRDCYVTTKPEPEINRRVYGTYDGKLRIEETRDFDLSSGHISEHDVCIASLSAAGPILTEQEITDGMKAYHTLEGVDGL